MKYDVVMTHEANQTATEHLLQHYQQGERQEDLCFALWRPSTGLNRKAAIVYEVILPQRRRTQSDGERELHPRVHLQSHLRGPPAECRLSLYAQPSRAGLAKLELRG